MSTNQWDVTKLHFFFLALDCASNESIIVNTVRIEAPYPQPIFVCRGWPVKESSTPGSECLGV